MGSARLIFVRISRAVVVLAVFAAVVHGVWFVLTRSPVIEWLQRTRLDPYWILYVLIAAAGAVLFAALMLIRWTGPRAAFREFGLLPVELTALFTGLVAVAVMAAAFQMMGREPSAIYSPPPIIMRAAMSVSGELLFVGFVFRQFRRWAGLPLWIAASVSSLLQSCFLIPFIIPASASHDVMSAIFHEILPGMGLSFVVAMLICWVTERWDSLWPAIIMSIGFDFVSASFSIRAATPATHLVNYTAWLAAAVAVIIATNLMVPRRKSAA